jgi:hypothetical protein
VVTLDGSAGPVTVEPGYVLQAPGLIGQATTVPPRGPTARGGGPEEATVALDDALAAAGLREARTLVLDVREQPAAAPSTARTRSTGDDGLILETPDLGPERGQVVLAIDEDGVMTWTHPEPSDGQAVRRGAGSTRFVVRRHVPAPSVEAAPTRGLARAVGHKLLKVLVYPVTDPALGAVSASFAGAWERRHRTYGLRTFLPAEHRSPPTASLDAAAVRSLTDGPALLFLHGTFSTSHAAFGGLSGETLAALHDLYQGRVLAFDHPTLSKTPQHNAERLLELLPSGRQLELDVVTHSRGGLVGRILAGALHTVDEVHVRRLVFGATPNLGTALTDADHLVHYLDRMTTMLNLLPPGPASAVTAALEAIVTVVKVVGRAGLTGLDGLAAMQPGGSLIQRLNTASVGGPEQSFALAADFAPTGGLRSLLTSGVVGAAADRVFGEPNDVVVPTAGVYDGTGPGFPVDVARRVQFDGAGVWHGALFRQPETASALCAWLTGDEGDPAYGGW